jgi:hypothetical protein
VVLIPAYLHCERRRVFDQSRVIALLIEKFHYFVPFTSGRHPKPVSSLLIVRLKLPEQLSIIEEVLEIVCGVEFEDIDVGAFFL